jgi:hypothetical protein
MWDWACHSLRSADPWNKIVREFYAMYCNGILCKQFWRCVSPGPGEEDISRGLWPPRSPDLNACHFICGARWKTKLYMLVGWKNFRKLWGMKFSLFLYSSCDLRFMLRNRRLSRWNSSGKCVKLNYRGKRAVNYCLRSRLYVRIVPCHCRNQSNDKLYILCYSDDQIQGDWGGREIYHT